MFRHPCTRVAGTLTFRSQIEPEADAHTAASDTHGESDVTNKPTIGTGIANAHIIDSDIHRNKLKGREGVDGRNRAVSTTRTLPATKTGAHFCLGSRKVSDLGHI